MSESNGNGNGHANGNGNGNGHAKVFSLKPAIDPATQAILEARDHALRDERLNRPMKAFFCLVLDRSLDPAYYHPHPRGVVTLSDTVLAEDFRVSNRTIYTWKRKIEECDYFWLTAQFRKNMWPITTYHLTCLHRPQRGRTDRDGTYGSAGVGRPPPQNPGLGARRPGQPGLPLPGSRPTPRKPKNADLLRISGGSGKTLRLSAEENFGSEPKNISGESRSQLRARAEENFGSEPKKTSGESRSPLRARAEADCQHIEGETTKEGDRDRGGEGEGAPPDQKFEQWSREVETMFPSKLRKLQGELKEKLATARTNQARHEWKRRLAVVDERLLGGKVEDAPQPKPAAPAPKPKEPTSEDRIAGARYLMSLGKPIPWKLTKAEKAALKEVPHV